MRILLLGGISEAKQLALGLIAQGHFVIYSLAGVVPTADSLSAASPLAASLSAASPLANCPAGAPSADFSGQIRYGGFSRRGVDGVAGLRQFCQQQRIELLIDATHPYAEIISNHAAQAAQLAHLDCWRYQRAAWHAADFPEWHDYQTWGDLQPQLQLYSKVFFSIGLSALRFIEHKPAAQQWFIRAAQPFKAPPGVTSISAIGPFSYQDEWQLLNDYRIEALVCKNSGGKGVIEKLHAARALGIPLWVQQRPQLPKVNKVFDEVDKIIAELVKSPHI